MLIKNITQRTRPYTKGFTLIELLIVVVVIAVLVGLVIIGYNGIQHRARHSALTAELDGVSKQLEYYRIDNSDVYPDDISAITIDDTYTTQYTAGPDHKSFCVTLSGQGVEMYVNSATRIPQDGVCEGHISQIASSEPDGTAIVVTELAMGDSHTCGLTQANGVYCWGQAANGALGNGNSSTNRLTPYAVLTSGALNGKTIVQISANYNHSCALDSEGLAYCWGQGRYGKLGNGGTSNSAVPVAVNTSGALSGKRLIQIDAGADHTCAVADDGTAYCWGVGSFGILGDGAMADSSTPVQVNTTTGALAGKQIAMIVAASLYTCVLDTTGTVYCWGSNTDGQIGNGGTATVYNPVSLATAGALNGKHIAKIAAGYKTTCALDDNGAFYCWGANSYGQVGNNSTSYASSPVAITTGSTAGKTVVEIATADTHSCAIADDNTAHCWGEGTYGMLGRGSTTLSTRPVAVTMSGALSGKTLKAIATSKYTSCVMDTGNEVYCWGRNLNGMFGNGSTSDATSATASSAPF